MARRLRKTTADYVAIAISPALIMTLVGSLVFFLIELFYVGEFHARLNYVFALFVFAAVLIARIAIELGSERAMLFGLALGIALFLVLNRFVQHPNPFSPLINICLIGILWWCADRLTWNCTLIDEHEDTSGEGLMQRIGVDPSTGSDASGSGPENRRHEVRMAHADLPGQQPELGSEENELLASDTADGSWLHAWWKRWTGRRGPHPPGMWVLYFSLAALPIFGLGQRLIPAADTGRRRYAFVLLTVYVISALLLLVTTSFLGLRRYLRQRRIEMPAPIAARWVISGGLLIVVVMLIAVLLPRPGAEYAVSQVPWQVRSPSGLTPSRRGFGPDGVRDPHRANNAGKHAEESQQAEQANADKKGQENQAARADGQSPRQPGQTGAQANGSRRGSQQNSQQNSQGQKSPEHDAKDQTHAKSASTGNAKPTSNKGQSTKPSGTQQTKSNRSTGSSIPPTSGHTIPPGLLEHPALPTSQIGALLGTLLKGLFYLAIGLAIGYLVWKNRRGLVAALIDLVRQLRAWIAGLLGGKSSAADAIAEETSVPPETAPPTFAQFQDPFLARRALPPEQLVRYTFEAFEAWARDRGIARRADQTPHELVRLAAPPQTGLSQEARRMVRLYNSLAYAGAKVPGEQAARLQTLWALMRKTRAPSRS